MAKKPARGRGKSGSPTKNELIEAPETSPQIIESENPAEAEPEVVPEAPTETEEVLITPPPDADPEAADTPKDAEIVEDSAETPVSDTETSVSDDKPNDTPEVEEAPVEETPEPRPEPQPTPVAAAAPPRQSVFIPMLLGGLVAGGIGYGVAYYQYGGLDPQVAEVLNEHSDSLLALEERVTEIPAEFNAAPLAEAVSGLEDRLSEMEAANSAAMDDIDARIAAVERQPNADGTLAESAVAAFEQDLQGLREQIVQQQQELEAMSAQASEELAMTREEAAAIEANALAAADAATRRAALSRIQGALESGAAFAPTLEELRTAMDAPVPPALADVAEDGVPTLAALQADFPAISREALRTARSEGVSGEDGGGLGGFLRDQFSVRSVAPQDGDNVDAILSRAEAALRDGRLNDTLAELAALPEPVRGTMTDWLSQAERRAAALDAATTLSMQFEG